MINFIKFLLQVFALSRKSNLFYIAVCDFENQEVSGFRRGELSAVVISDGINHLLVKEVENGTMRADISKHEEEAIYEADKRRREQALKD